MAGWVAGAIAVTGLASSAIGASAAKSAANKQSESADAALAQQGAGAIASIENQRQVLADQLRVADETTKPQIQAQLDSLNNQLRVAQETRDAQLGVSKEVRDAQLATYGQVWDAQKGYYTPYQEAGLAGQSRLLNYLGIGPISNAGTDPNYGKFATAEFTPEMFAKGIDPGYAFRLDQGLKGLDRQAAARGGLISGNALKAASDFAGDQASQEYQNAFSRYQTTRNNTLAPYVSLQGVGYNAATGLANAAGTYGANVGNAWNNYGTGSIGAYGGYGGAAGGAYGATGNNLTNIYGNAGTNSYNAYGNAGNQFTGAMTGYGNNASNLITGSGNAQAAGTVGAANAVTGGVSNAMNMYYQNQLLNTLGNRNTSAYAAPTGGFTGSQYATGGAGSGIGLTGGVDSYWKS